MSANFLHLRGYDEQLFRLGFLAELLAQQVAARFGVEIRVERALQRILASRSWSRPQRDWLQRIANQTKVIPIVDREALAILDAAGCLNDLQIPPGNRLEPLRGDRHGQHSIRINEQFRLCFVWTDAGPEGVEIIDYH